MEFEQYINKIDLYEVDKQYFKTYQWQLRDRKLVAYEHNEVNDTGRIITTFIVDEETDVLCLGFQVRPTEIANIPETHYYIFEILDDDKLNYNNPKTFQEVKMSAEDYVELMKKLCPDKTIKGKEELQNEGVTLNA